MRKRRSIVSVTRSGVKTGSLIMASDFDLSGKVAIVTGGNGGIA
jgi:hypothetical protein